ncbi:MAG TPA: helix-turn-helix domain-containing protein [Chloroflexota bacterium]
MQVGNRQAGDHRSECPINLSLEVLGDSWSLLIIRDLVFGDARHFRELLRSQEGISSNILADRLKKLLTSGIISSADDPTHKQKTVYSLTEMGIALVPTLVNLGSWGRTFLPASDELSVRIEFLEKGGPSLRDEFMDELRQTHLDTNQPPRQGPTVRERLDTAYNSLAHD